MQNEDNDSLKEVPLILESINQIKDESDEICNDFDEINSCTEMDYYSEIASDNSQIVKKSKYIGKIASVGISSIGLLTFFVAIIFSMMNNNSFKVSVTNLKIEVKEELKNAISYSFSYTNPYGISMYCDLKTIDNESICKTKIQGLGVFEGIFMDLDYNCDYTFVVYSEQYNSKIYYFESDILHIDSFTDSDFKMDYFIENKDDKRILNYKLKYPYDEIDYWYDFRFLIESVKERKTYSIEAMEGFIEINDINSDFDLSVYCYDAIINESKLLLKIHIILGENNGSEGN